MENIHGNAIRIRTTDIDSIIKQIDKLLKNSPQDNLHIELTGQVFKLDNQDIEYQIFLQLCDNDKILS